MNNFGQRTAVTTTGEPFARSPADWTWNYDALGQLTQANAHQYTYDQIGNRRTSGKNNETLTTYTANALNQYTAINTVAPAYDADGNQHTNLTPTASHPNRASLTFTYNAHNRPIEIRQNGELKKLRTYDHMGRRIRTGDTLTLYDGYNAIAEYNLNTHTLQTTLAWGNDLSNTPQGAGGVGGLLSITEHNKQTPTTAYPCYDGNGNITEYLTEENGGTLAAHYEYDAFGNVIKKTGEREYSYQFSTKPYDALTGLNYYNYRDYDPVNGRWINRDPIEERGGTNLCGFNVNDAVNKKDYLGLEIVVIEFQMDSTLISAMFGNGILGYTYANPTMIPRPSATPNSKDGYTAKIDPIQEIDILVISNIPSSSPSGYGWNGLQMIIEHERRRVQVYENGYNTYIKPMKEKLDNKELCCEDQYLSFSILAEYSQSIIDEYLGKYDKYIVDAQKLITKDRDGVFEIGGLIQGSDSIQPVMIPQAPKEINDPKCSD